MFKYSHRLLSVLLVASLLMATGCQSARKTAATYNNNDYAPEVTYDDANDRAFEANRDTSYDSSPDSTAPAAHCPSCH